MAKSPLLHCVQMKALMLLAMLTADRSESMRQLAGMPGAASTLMQAMQSPDVEAASVAKDLFTLIARDPAAKANLEQSMRTAYTVSDDPDNFV